MTEYRIMVETEEMRTWGKWMPMEGMTPGYFIEGTLNRLFEQSWLGIWMDPEHTEEADDSSAVWMSFPVKGVQNLRVDFR